VSRPCVLWCTDLVQSAGGIQRVNDSLVDALPAATGTSQLRVVSLWDTPEQLASRAWPARADLAGCAGSRLRFVLRALTTVLRQPTVLVVAHVHFAVLVPIVRCLAPRTRVVTILYGEECWPRLTLARRLGLRCSSRVLAISRYTRETAIRSQGLHSDRVHMVHLALNPRWAATDARAGSPSRPFFLVVSRLDPEHLWYKGVDHTLEAFARLAESPAFVHDLVICGGGAAHADLERQIAARGLAGRVRVTGRVGDDELQRLYAGCTALVLPSSGEGFGLVYLEAMTHAKPVIAAAETAVPEVVLDGESGMLVRYGDVAAIAAAMSSIGSDHQLADRLGRAGRRRVLTEFSFERFARRLAETLRAA
jgi:phosphatidylinositol alpha-1,6-mannosyltransferase